MVVKGPPAQAEPVLGPLRRLAEGLRAPIYKEVQADPTLAESADSPGSADQAKVPHAQPLAARCEHLHATLYHAEQSSAPSRRPPRSSSRSKPLCSGANGAPPHRPSSRDAGARPLEMRAALAVAAAALPLAAHGQDECKIPELPHGRGISMHEYTQEPEATKCWPSQTLCPTATADCPSTCELDCSRGWGGDGTVDAQGLHCVSGAQGTRLEHNYPTCTSAPPPRAARSVPHVLSSTCAHRARCAAQSAATRSTPRTSTRRRAPRARTRRTCRAAPASWARRPPRTAAARRATRSRPGSPLPRVRPRPARRACRPASGRAWSRARTGRTATARTGSSPPAASCAAPPATACAAARRTTPATKPASGCRLRAAMPSHAALPPAGSPRRRSARGTIRGRGTCSTSTRQALPTPPAAASTARSTAAEMTAPTPA